MKKLLSGVLLVGFGLAAPRTVHPDGIHFQGLRYLDLTLAAYVGEAVQIRYDPRDLAEIRIYHRDIFLCRAVCAELAGHTLALKDLVRARTERRRELRGTLTDREQLVRQYLAVHDVPPEPVPPAAAAAVSAWLRSPATWPSTSPDGAEDEVPFADAVAPDDVVDGPIAVKVTAPPAVMSPKVVASAV